MKTVLNINRLPALTMDNLEEIMAERLAATRDCDTSIPMLWQGLWELPFSVEDEERSALYYIPEGTPQGTALVILNIPEGEAPLAFLQTSGWITLADQEGFCLYALVPAAGGWKETLKEASYVHAAVAEARKGRYLLAGFAPYVAAYGRIGSLLQCEVLEDPLHTAAAVFLGSESVTAAYLAEFEKKEYCVSDRFASEALPLRVPYSAIPTPVWILSAASEQTDAALSYWRRAARAGRAQEDAVLGTVWRQAGATDYTAADDLVLVAQGPEPENVCAQELTRAVHAFFRRFYRYGMGPLSNTISRRVEPEDIGVERRSFVDRSGAKREYLVYVPEEYRDGRQKLPVVLAFHGASQSMRNMMANGRWYEIADREGLVVVYPECTLRPMNRELSRGEAFAYRPLWTFSSEAHPRMDAIYVDELLDRVIAEFPVDEKRIFSNGHSMGCMMSNYLGSDEVGRRLTAIGASSGCLMACEHSAGQAIPSFMTLGQFDLWSYRLQDEGPVADELNMWLKQNGLASEETVADRRCHPDASWQVGRWVHHAWMDAAGTPWLRYAWIIGKHHVHTYEENVILWEQWFSRWSIGEDGERHYA